MEGQSADDMKPVEVNKQELEVLSYEQTKDGTVMVFRIHAESTKRRRLAEGPNKVNLGGMNDLIWAYGDGAFPASHLSEAAGFLQVSWADGKAKAVEVCV